MRLHLALLGGLVAALLSGCSSSGTPDAEPVGPVASGLVWTLPENITLSDSVTASVQGTPLPVPAVGGVGVGCGAPGAYCQGQAFTVAEPEGWAGLNESQQQNATINATAVLTWGIDQHDFDLAIFDADGELVAGDAAYPPGTTATVVAPLAPGDYTVEVSAWFVTADDYTLNVSFAA